MLDAIHERLAFTSAAGGVGNVNTSPAPSSQKRRHKCATERPMVASAGVKVIFESLPLPALQQASDALPATHAAAALNVSSSGAADE